MTVRGPTIRRAALAIGLATAGIASAQTGVPFVNLQEQINALQRRIQALEAPDGRVAEVRVECGRDSINAAIGTAPSGGNLVVIVDGTCEEAVNVVRDRVALRGGLAGVVRAPAGAAAITVGGAQNVEVIGLTVVAAPGFEGIRAERNADVRIRNTSVVDNGAGPGAFGIFATSGASVNIAGSQIIGSSGGMAYGVTLSDGAVGRMQGTIVTLSAGTDGAVYLSRQSTLLMRGGGNVITHTLPGGPAFGATNGSSLRVDQRGSAPTDIFNGRFYLTQGANGDVRDAIINGNVMLQSQAGLRLSDETRNAPYKLTVNGGPINVGDTALLQFLGTAPFIGANAIVNCGGKVGPLPPAGTFIPPYTLTFNPC
jgi:hypothetical protein